MIGPGKAGLEAAIAKDPFLQKNRDKIAVLPRPFNRDPNHLGVPKKMNLADFLPRFNRAIKKGWDSGAFQKIVNSYAK